MSDSARRLFKQSRGEAHARLALFLVGHGVELPGGVPFAVPYPGVDVSPAGDVRALEPASVSFVVASHVLGQAADPVGDLAEIERVLAPGGVLLLLLPDRRLAPRSRIAGEQRWTEDEFPAVLTTAIGEHDQAWELLDALFVGDVDDGDEYGYVLRRGTTPLDSEDRMRRFAMMLSTLGRRTRHLNALHAELERALGDLAATRAQARIARAEADAATEGLDRVRALPGYPVLRATQQLGSMFRRSVGRSC